MSDFPLVSFIVIAHNAAWCLPHILSDILIQNYLKEKIEIILVNGKSTDDTHNIMENFAKAHQELNVKVLDNPGKILSCGWNVALSEAKGDIILRVDAHSSISSDFISRNVEAILSGENIVGGATISKKHEAVWPGLLSLAEGSKFGGSAADFRNLGPPPRHVDTLAYAAYKRSVFEKVGGYDERLVRNQDNEIHCRMRKAGFKFFFNPSIKSFHTPRSTLYDILKQKYNNGFWIGLIIGIQPRCFGMRHFVSALFVLALIILLGLGISGMWFSVISLGILYGIMAFIFAMEAMLKAQTGIKKTLCIVLPFVFLSMHVVYGIGTLVGLIKMPFFVWKTRGYKIPYPIN